MFSLSVVTVVKEPEFVRAGIEAVIDDHTGVDQMLRYNSYEEVSTYVRILSRAAKSRRASVRSLRGSRTHLI